MRFAYLKYRLKKLGCYLLIIILLPYIITVFLSGPGTYGASRVDETMVNVKADGEKSGSDGGKQEDSNAENVDKIQIDTGQRKICRIPGEQINMPSIISGLSMHGRRPTDRC